MVKKILMEFEKGGQVAAIMPEDKAPRTCEAIWDALPLERSVLHEFAGEEIFL